MVLVNQVVEYFSTLNAIQIDRRTTRSTVSVKDIAVDFGIGADSVATLAGVCVDLDAGGIVAEAGIVTDDGPVAAVGYVDAVFILGAGAGIVFQEQVVGKTGKDAAFKIIAANAVADRAVVGEGKPDAITGLVHDTKPFQNDVVGILDVDAIVGFAVRLIDDDRFTVGPESDGQLCCPGSAQIKPGVGSVAHQNDVPGLDFVGGML